MTKVWISGIGLAVAVAAVVVILFSDEALPELPGSSTQKESSVKTAVSDEKSEKIVYDRRMSEERRVLNKIGKPIGTKKKIPRDPKVKYQATDSSGRYGIQLIDESNPGAAGGETVGFVGTINGNRFIVRVPKSVQADDLKLRIVDRKTKAEQIVSLPFVAELGKPGYAPEMKVDFDDAQNYTAESNPQVAAVFP